MPSIPQSLLWISLVVLWLFVLVPMLVGKRDAVRRTSDVALATRVLTGGAGARLLKRGGPASGHRSDPHWRAASGEDSELDAEPATESGTVVVAAVADERVEPDYLDVDVVDEDSGALPVGGGVDSASGDVDESGELDEPVDVDESGELDDEYQTEDLDEDLDGDGAAEPAADADTVEEDTSGLEAEGKSSEERPTMGGSSAARRRRYDSTTANAVSARKYAFRKRVLMAMAVILVVSAVLAFTVTSGAWWLCATTTAVTVLYLAYLRRQTRIEEQVRARRVRRMARSRAAGVANDDYHAFDVVPSRLRRPGAAVLEIDDEDPTFEHLEYASFAQDYDWRRDLPRAAGE